MHAHLHFSLLTAPCRPERWEDIPEAVKAIPGVFGNLMTFINGAHACIGYRFAVTE
jgi:cytochrome P450